MTPNVKCPHCSKIGCVQVTGFASELATREKYCRFCNEKFYVHLIITTSKKEEIRDGKISELKEKIIRLSKKRKKIYTELFIECEGNMSLIEKASRIIGDMRKGE
jgi:hypothetical protein